MSEKKIAWEIHPVSAERKAELRAQGYKIIDARFKPMGDDTKEPADDVVEESSKRRGRTPKE